MDIIIKVLLGALLCLCGGFLVYRVFKPKLNNSETTNKDLNDIKEEWNELEHEKEITIDFVYKYACEYEKNRVITKLAMFIVGMAIIVGGASIIIEIF